MAISKWDFINVGLDGTFSGDGRIQTSPADVERLVDELIAQKPEHLLFLFHGGLVSEARAIDGINAAHEQLNRNGIRPIYFIWETGLPEIVDDILGEMGGTWFSKVLQKVARLVLPRVTSSGEPSAAAFSPAFVVQEMRKAEPFAEVSTAAGAAVDIQEDPTELAWKLEQEAASVLNEDRVQMEALLPMLPASIAKEGEGRYAPAGLGLGVSFLGLVKAVASIAFRCISRHRRVRDHGIYCTLAEETLREVGLATAGQRIWSEMKERAREMWLPNEGLAGLQQHAGRYFVERLAAALPGNGGWAPTIDLAGHSAGAVVVCELLNAVSTSGISLQFRNIVLHAPACTTRLFVDQVVRRASTPKPPFAATRVFTMTAEAEQEDNFGGPAYPRSLLYFISGVLEKEADAPILGLERHIYGTTPVRDLELQRYFDAQHQSKRLVLTPTTEAAPGFASGARSHAAFASDLETLESLVEIVSPGGNKPAAPMHARIEVGEPPSAPLGVSNEFETLVSSLAQATGLPAGANTGSLSDKAMRVLNARHVKPEPGPEPITQKNRYVVSQPANVPFAGPVVRGMLKDIHASLQPSILRSQHEDGPKVMSMTALEAALMRQRYSGLAVERDIQHSPFLRSPLVPELVSVAVPQAGARNVTVKVVGPKGEPIVGAEVLLFTNVAHRQGFKGTTDGTGSVRLLVHANGKGFEKVVVLAQHSYWSKVAKKVPVPADGNLRIPLERIQVNGYDWSLKLLGVDKRKNNSGRGVKVAVIDSGISADHPSLAAAVAGGRNFILNEPEDAWSNDLSGHGTHCAGVIAAAANLKDSIWGCAPGIEMYALRVFGGVDGGGYSSDIGDAIEWAVNEGCNLVNLSLGSHEGSSYIRQKVEAAFNAGTLCIAAAGNDGGPVAYPARFRTVFGVSAIGQKDVYPRDSLQADAEQGALPARDQLYFASFSNHGEGVDACAPGVGITSTLPGGFFGPMDGTSMACPHVTGIAALALSRDQKLKAMGKELASRLSDQLIGMCRDMGLDRDYQGAGLVEYR